MATRTTKVVLEASIGQYEANLRKASKATDELAKSATESGKATDRAGKQAEQGSQQSSKASRDAAKAHKEAEKAARDRADAVETLGKGMVLFGTVTVAALGATAKAAIEWESAWAGVNKTVDGTPEQMAELEGELRGLAKTLPLTHKEIAGVAEAAGQLGIAREDITGFTKTMIDLGETTNLSAEEASTSIAQMMNVMQSAPDDVDNLGSALVALGNNGASTEADILKMAQRIAGTGKLIGATEADVLALSNTLASLGIRAEAGGGSASRVLQQMYSDVEENGENLDRFAKVTGTSAEEFATAFREDPIGAMDMFSQGLGRIKGEGGNVIGTLKDLGITSTEDTRTLLALAGAGDMLTESLALGSKAWEENTALAAEAAKRYETTEAKISIAWNNIKDAAIDAGAVILPVIAGVAESVADLAGWFSDLPEPVQGALTAISGLVGVSALAGGAFLLLLPKVQASSKALRSLGKGGEIADKGLRKVGKAAGVAGAIAGVGIALAKIVESNYMDDIDTGMGRVAEVMVDLANDAPDATAALDELFKDRDGGTIIKTVDGIDSALRRTFDRDGGEKFNDFAEGVVNGMIGIEGSSQILEGAWERQDQALADLVNSGNAETAAESFEKISAAAERNGVSVEELATIFPQYGDALRQAEADAKLAADGADGATVAIEDQAAAAEEAAAASKEMQKALAEIGVSAQGTVSDLTDFTNSLVSAGLLTLSTRDSARQYEASLDALTASIAENGTTLDLNTEKGRANEAALDGIASAGLSYAEALATETDQLGQNVNSQADVSAALQQTYDDYYANARAMGYSKDEATALAREVLSIPDDVSIETFMEETAKLMAEDTTGAVNDVPDEKNVTFMAHDNGTIGVMRDEIAGVEGKTVPVPVSDNGTISAEQQAINLLHGKTTSTPVSDDGTIDATQYAIDILTGKTLPTPVTDEGTIFNTQQGISGLFGKTTGTPVTDNGTIFNTQTGINNIYGKDVAVNVTSNAAAVQSAINLLRGTTIPVSIARVPGNADGGRIPKHADGGRLPLTGPGTQVTDGILGVSSMTGEPTSYVDAGEWVVREKMAAKFNGLLTGVNADAPDVQHLAGAINTGTPRNVPGYAGGARVGREHAVSNYYAAPAGGGSELVSELLAAVRTLRPVTVNGVPADQVQKFADVLNFEINRPRGKYSEV